MLWIPRSGRDKLQYLAGLGIHVVWSPFLTQIVLFYSLFHCDDFKWGKTREVVEETEEEREILRIQNEKNDEDADTTFDAATDELTLWRNRNRAPLRGLCHLWRLFGRAYNEESHPKQAPAGDLSHAPSFWSRFLQTLYRSTRRCRAEFRWEQLKNSPVY